MKKHLLTPPTQFYANWPSWLVALVAPLMIWGFILIGQFFALPVLFAVLALWAGLTDNLTSLITGQIPLHIELSVFPFVALTLFAWVKFVEKRSIVSLGFFKEGWLKDLLLGFAFGGLLYGVCLGLIVLLGGAELVATDTSAGTWWFVLTTIPFWLVQGGTEEVLTRGWLLPVLKHKTNLPLAILISSSVFALLHLSNNHMTLLSLLDLFLYGLLTALYLLKAGNIWGVVGLHGAWNFFQGNVFGVAVSGTEAGPSILRFAQIAGAPDWLSGGAFGTEGSLISNLVQGLVIIYLLYSLKKDGTIGAKA